MGSSSVIGQAGIAVFGVLAIWFTQSPNARTRRWACIFGIASQPFFYYEAWISHQWATFGLTIIYGLAWARGLWHGWLKNERAIVKVKDSHGTYDGRNPEPPFDVIDRRLGLEQLAEKAKAWNALPKGPNDAGPEHNLDMDGSHLRDETDTDFNLLPCVACDAERKLMKAIVALGDACAVHEGPHEWVSMKNAAIESGEMCILCYRAGGPVAIR